MKKLITMIISISIIATMLTACDGSNKVNKKVTAYPVSVNNIVVDKAPKAVASLSPMLTNILTGLGYTSNIVGYSTGEVLPKPVPKTEPAPPKDDGFHWFWEKKEEPVSPEPQKPLPSGEIGTALKPDMEKIGEFMPEIIFTTLPLTKAQMDKLDQVKIKVVVIPPAKTLDELKSVYTSVITIMSGQLEADSIGKSISEEIGRQADYIASLVPSTKQSFMYIENLDPIIATGDSFESNLLSFVGVNVFADCKSYTVDSQQLAKADPDVILYSSDINPENIKQSALFKDKKAVKEEKLIGIDPMLLFNRTMTAPESIRTVAKLIYPDINFDEPQAPESSDNSK